MCNAEAKPKARDFMQNDGWEVHNLHVREDALHGRSLLTLSLTSKTHPYKAGFEPFARDIYRLPYAHCHRCSDSLTYPDGKLHCAAHLEDTFLRVVAAPAAIEAIGAQFRDRALAWKQRFPVLGDIRGFGAMQASNQARSSLRPWIGSTHFTGLGSSTGSISRFTTTASLSLRTSTHSRVSSPEALISWCGT